MGILSESASEVVLVAEAPLGQLPVLLWDGEALAQSMAIARFVARKTGLAGDDDVEFARADIIAEHVNDAITSTFRTSSRAL